MKTLLQRLWWAVAGYRTEPWPVLPPPPQVLTQAELESVFDNRLPGGILSPYQHDHLRGSIKLAADLLAPHFQSAISAHGVFTSANHELVEHPIGLTEYFPATTAREEIDLLFSAGVWLAKQTRLKEDEAVRLWLVAKDDIYHPRG